MKIGILTVAFRAERFIEAWARQFQGMNYDFVPLVVCGKRGWHSDWKQDNTPELARAQGLQVLEGQWENDADQRNAGLDFLRSEGCEWALVIDTDEFYTSEGIYALVYSTHAATYSKVRAPIMDVYWKSAGFKIVPEQPDNPIVAIKTDQRFEFSRLSPGPGAETQAHLYHMSYVRTDKEMLAKIESFEHHFEVVPNWYEEVWKKWDLNKFNLHPVVPEQFRAAVNDPAPAEILELFEC